MYELENKEKNSEEVSKELITCLEHFLLFLDALNDYCENLFKEQEKNEKGD